MQCDRGRIHSIAEAVRALHNLVARTPTATRVVHGGARAGQDPDGRSRGVRRPTLGRKEGGVHEEEEVWE